MAEKASSSRAPVCLPTYNLGDEGKPNHFNASVSRETAADEAKSLAVGDAAFIKRSDLKWTYAVVFEKIEGDSLVLRFEVDKDKNHKSFPEAQWGKYIRVIHVEESELAALQIAADKMKEEEAKASEEAKPFPSSAVSIGGESIVTNKTGKSFLTFPSSAVSIGGESIVTSKTGKSFLSGLPSIFSSPKKEAKKEDKKEEETKPKPDEEVKVEGGEIKEDKAKTTEEDALEETNATEEAAPKETKAEAGEIKNGEANAPESIESDETKAIETILSAVAPVGGESTSNTTSKGFFSALPSIFGSSFKKEEDMKPEPEEAKEKEQPEIVVTTLATPEDTAPEAPEDEPDNTKENSNPVQDALKGTISALRSPLRLKPTFSTKRNQSSNASATSKSSLLNKFGLKKDTTPPMPTQTKVMFETSKNTTKNTVNALGDTNMMTTASDNKWVDSEACEVDYDKNPTDLFQALEAREFGYVASIYKQTNLQFTKQCKTWVVARGQEQHLLRFRALPLHAALVFGAPDDLVLKILNAYPLAARGRDVKGRLPIHLAMEHNASEGVVALIIEAFPKGMFVTDKKNMAPLDYINGNMGRIHMKKYMPLVIAAKVEEERAKWEVALAEALEEQRVLLKSDADFIKPIVEAVTEDVENIYAGKLSLVETNYQKEAELMKKKHDSETQALLDGFEVKLNFERKLQKLKGEVVQ